MKVGVLGSKPPEMGGFDPENSFRWAIREGLRKSLRHLKATSIVTTLDQGVESDVVDVAEEMGLDVYVKATFPSPPKFWSAPAQETFLRQKEIAKSFDLKDKEASFPEWFIEGCDAILVIYSGSAVSRIAAVEQLAIAKGIKTVVKLTKNFEPLSIIDKMARVMYVATSNNPGNALKEIDELPIDTVNEMRSHARTILSLMQNEGLYIISKTTVEDVKSMFDEIREQISQEGS